MSDIGIVRELQAHFDAQDADEVADTGER